MPAAEKQAKSRIMKFLSFIKGFVVNLIFVVSVKLIKTGEVTKKVSF